MVDTEAAMGAGEGMEASGAAQAISIYYKVKDPVGLEWQTTEADEAGSRMLEMRLIN